MKKRMFLAAATAALSMMFAGSAFAGTYGWQQDANGWAWKTHGGNLSAGWHWIDGNCDNVSECYYIDGNGYMLANTTTPDGYQVNADGQWVENGTVKTRLFAADLGDLHPEADDQLAANASAATGSGPVTDANSIQKITFNTEVMDWLNTGYDTLNNFPNKTLAENQWDAVLGPTYNAEYKGGTIRFTTDKDINGLRSVYGPAKLIFNNIPEQGIELNAFYDSLGYESWSTGRRAQGSTGMSDSIFGLPMGSYRYAQVDYDTGLKRGGLMVDRHYSILLTPNDGNSINSSDCVWYIYPDSMVDVD